jgi:DNA-binding NarL/FixJ family response regulator
MAELAPTSHEQMLARELLAEVAQQLDVRGAFSVFSASIIDTVAQALARYRVELATVPPDVSRLTKRERNVVDDLCAGLRPHDIAKRMCISHHTVRNHLKHAFRKMRVTSQIELVAAMRGTTSQPRQALADGG